VASEDIFQKELGNLKNDAPPLDIDVGISHNDQGFISMFVNGNVKHENFAKLSMAISNYKKVSKNHLRIEKSIKGFCQQYVCQTHKKVIDLHYLGLLKMIQRFVWFCTGSKDIINIAKSFSKLQEHIYFQKIDAISNNAVQYIMNINPKRWRSTEWLDDTHYLPPRYGIVTSNASESSNKMYKGASYGTWLNTLNTIWNITGDRISKKF
jgi:hypothetical protein